MNETLLIAHIVFGFSSLALLCKDLITKEAITRSTISSQILLLLSAAGLIASGGSLTRVCISGGAFTLLSLALITQKKYLKGKLAS